MTARAFNLAAQSYTFDLDREVAAFYRDHPEQKRRIFYIDASTMPGTLYRGKEDDIDEVAALLADNADLAAFNKIAFERGSRADRYYALEYGTVLLNLSLPAQQNLLGVTLGNEISAAYIFDHETDHLNGEDGLSKRENRNECEADAYAMLRHIQRFGRDSPALEKLMQRRALEMIAALDGSHFTAPVLEKIIADNKTTDFTRLTPEETVALAGRYARENAENPLFVSYMLDSFRALRLDMSRVLDGDTQPLRELASFAMRTTVPEELKWSTAAVHALLDGDLAFDGRRLPAPAGNWQGLRRDLDGRAARLGLNVPKLIVPKL
jgi:hypothetical protein